MGKGLAVAAIILCLSLCTSIASDCSEALIRIDPRTGEFVIRKSSLQFQAWRAKAAPHAPDSAFAYEILSDEELESAHALQSRYATEKNLISLDKSEVIQDIESLGKVKFPADLLGEGFFLPNKVISQNLQLGEMIWLKYILFEKGGKFFCFIWKMTDWGPSHPWVATTILDSVKGSRIVGGSSFSLSIDKLNGVNLVTYRKSVQGRMGVDDQLRRRFVPLEERIKLTSQFGLVDMIVFGFIKRSLTDPAWSNAGWRLK